MFVDGSRLARVTGGLGRVAPRKLDKGVWLWRREPNRVRVRRIGPAKLGSYLLTDAAAVRSNPRAYQAALCSHLSDQLLETLLRRLQVNVVLDVGANRGQFAQRVRRLGYAGRIVSYEPVSTTLPELRRAADADPDWLVEDFALGDRDSTAEINVAAGPGSLSSLLPGTEFGRERFENMRAGLTSRETIRVRRLDGVFERAVAGVEDPRVFLKLDTQGYDLLALAGAGRHVKDLVGLQSEVSCIPIYAGMPHLTEQIAAYEEAGFTPAGMFPVTRDDKSLAVIEFDLLMLRREHP